VVGPAEGGTGLVLAVAPADSDVVGRQGGGDVGFFLRTDDFDVQYARMLKYGVHFREAPRFESYGTVAIFEDLYGMPSFHRGTLTATSAPIMPGVLVLQPIQLHMKDEVGTEYR
jgi:hypothetical protein